MRSILATILFFLCAGQLLTAQMEGIAPYPDNKENFYAYFFKQFGVLRDDVKIDKSKTLSQKDSADIFIADSIRFHHTYSYFHQRLPHACQNRFYKSGVIGIEQEVLVPFEYDWVQPKFSSLLLVRKAGKTGIINSDGDVIIPFRYADFYIYHSNLIAFKNRGADSVIMFYDGKGRLLFQSHGYGATKMGNDYVTISDKQGKFREIRDMSGKSVFATGSYENIKWVRGDMFCAYKNKKYGIISSASKIVLPFEYDNIIPGAMDQFIVYKDHLSGVVDLRNKIIVPFDSVYITSFGTLYAIRELHSGRSGLINSKGQELLLRKYNIYPPPDSGDDDIPKIEPHSILSISDAATGLIGIYRADGIEILPIAYSYMHHRQDQISIIIGKKAGSPADNILFAAINIDGKILVPFSKNSLQYIEASPDLLLSKNVNGLSAFVNARTGEIFTAYEFEGTEPLYPLTHGYVAAKKNWLYALISPEGKKLTEAVYSGFYPVTKKNRLWFSEEIVCLGRLGEKLYGITKTGKAIPTKK